MRPAAVLICFSRTFLFCWSFFVSFAFSFSLQIDKRCTRYAYIVQWFSIESIRFRWKRDASHYFTLPLFLSLHYIYCVEFLLNRRWNIKLWSDNLLLNFVLFIIDFAESNERLPDFVEQVRLRRIKNNMILCNVVVFLLFFCGNNK